MGDILGQFLERSTWFTSWERVGDIVIGAVFFFFLIIAMVRLSGKRLTSQMNNFDWIVSIAIGGLACSGILLEGVAIVDSTAAIVVLVALQMLITVVVRKSEVVRKIMKPTPTLLTHKGKFIEENLDKERVSKAEIRARLREQGYTSLDQANWVILETDGNLTVIPEDDVKLSEVELMEEVTHPEEAIPSGSGS